MNWAKTTARRNENNLFCDLVRHISEILRSFTVNEVSTQWRHMAVKTSQMTLTRLFSWYQYRCTAQNVYICITIKILISRRVTHGSGFLVLFRGLTQMYIKWRHNGCDGVSNHWGIGCLFNRLLILSSKKTSRLRVTDLCEGNPPVTRGFPSQRASNAENVSIWWRHYDFSLCLSIPRGKLTCIIGNVGSGKSALLTAILGELYQNEGTLAVKVSTGHLRQGKNSGNSSASLKKLPFHIPLCKSLQLISQIRNITHCE